MRRREFLKTGAGAVLGFLGAPKSLWAAETSPSGRRPNIIVIFADDQGYADLGCQGQLDDVHTPHLDRVAREGVRCAAGYITAPQCSPSRAGLLTGRYQQRFGLNHIPDCPLPLKETTLADRLQGAGYVTGMVGKWHLEPNRLSWGWAQTALPKDSVTKKDNVPVPWEKAQPYYPGNRGFSEFFKGEMRRYYANYGLDGGGLAPDGVWIDDKRFRVDVQSDAAVAFIKRHQDEPFFLYLAFFAPHTPLEADDRYLARFPGEMPERRRYALAMIAAMDDGVGRILDTLGALGLDEDTLVVYTSDNGAPLKLTRPDNPVTSDPGGWDGSLNDPWVGEKGMLSEGGIRVPFLFRWKGMLPENQVYGEPVSSLDLAATAAALAGLPPDPALDGINLMPYLTGDCVDPPSRALYWRFWNQAAIRKGRWKYLQAGQTERFLFDLDSPEHETRNLLEELPGKAQAMKAELEAWSAGLIPAGLSGEPLNIQEQRWYAQYFGRKKQE